MLASSGRFAATLKAVSVFRVALAAAALLLCFGASAECALSPAPHPDKALGLQLFYPDEKRSWEAADDLGVDWIRLEVRWDWYQPTATQYDSSYIDRVMALAGEHRQRILLLLNHAPHWALSSPALFPARAATALQWLVRRHGGRISAYQIFNEPNLPGYGWESGGQSVNDSATLYARTLAAAGSAIRELDKTAFVVAGGLSPQGDPETYLRLIARQTPPNCYDSLAAHPYGFNSRFAEVRRNVAAVLAQENRPPKPLWLSEYGSPDNDQRAMLLESLVTDRMHSPITFFFTEKDIGKFTNTYGLMTRDGQPKSDYFLFKRLFAKH